jgi:glucose-1-phosphate cytidylyltransferase
MKVVILAGGLGSRLSEETEVRPKPMVEIGGRPILWHIMKLYSHYGYNEFVVALGYKGDVIKRFFLEYHLMGACMTVNTRTGAIRSHTSEAEEWTVHLVDTGLATLTGGRVKRLQEVIGNQRFLLTYGDGVSDLDIRALVRQHESNGTVGTVTAVHPPARYGELVIEGNHVQRFSEKSQTQEGYVNGGFMVFEPQMFEYLSASEKCILEVDGLERMASDGQLGVYKHKGFWQCMDTVREKRLLESLWNEQRAPWKMWST